mmetsp:Transcript_29813/g.53614  ORF Transcript_29813/g.53614 Transcript_29813/m.53614 type:complete len:218 (-) Transcript_29813:699-1352(-)
MMRSWGTLRALTASISATIALSSKLSVRLFEVTSMSTPALTACTMTSPTDHWLFMTAFMSNESENTIPSYPSWVRRMSWMKTEDIVAGLPGSTFGYRMCAVMIPLTFARTAAAKGFSSTFQSASSDLCTCGSSKWESVVVSPWPGKCLATAPTDCACPALIMAAPSEATRLTLPLIARSPITGFDGLLLTSMTGSKLRSIFTALNSRNFVADTSFAT